MRPWPHSRPAPGENVAQLGGDSASGPEKSKPDTSEAPALTRKTRGQEEDEDDAESDSGSGSGASVKVSKSEIKEMYTAETMYQTVVKLGGEAEKGAKEKAKSLLD